jgi:polar amino acid transport system permease protein
MSAPRVVPAPHWGERLVAALLVAIVAGLAVAVGSSRSIEWSAIPQYLLDPTILAGVRLTLVFTVLSMVIAILAGVVLALMRLSPNPVLSGFASLYVWFFRGTPLLVQIIFWFNIQLFIPSIVLGGWRVETNSIISAFTAALLALSLNEAAYVAEIVRSGLLAVDRGQREAASALGYTPFQAMTRIVLPQALRVIVPPIGNQTISMLKTTSLVSVVAAQDLLTRAHLCTQLPCHRAAGRCEHLVSCDDDRRVRRSVDHRTAARPCGCTGDAGLGTRAAESWRAAGANHDADDASVGSDRADHRRPQILRPFACAARHRSCRLTRRGGVRAWPVRQR